MAQSNPKGAKKTTKRALAGVAALLFVATVVWTTLPASSDTKPSAERAASPDLMARNLDGEQISLGDYPQKVKVVNFWAVNCHACRIEIPHLQSLYNKYKDVTIIGMGLDNDVEEIKRFVDRTDITYPVLVDGWETARAFDFRATPTTVLLDAHNRVYKTYVGVQGIETFKSDIDALLAERS